MGDPMQHARMQKTCSACRHGTEVPVPACNLCGLSCALTQWNEDGLWIANGVLNCTVHGSYHSTPGNGHGALDDCVSYTFSLCEWCLDWLFTHSVCPPMLSTMDGTKPFRPAAERVASWLKILGKPAPMEAEFLAELERRNAARRIALEKGEDGDVDVAP
jgi:hypothetical protein